MNLIAACVANPVKAAVGVLLLTLFGGLALLTMPVQLTPEVQIPTILVETRWPGASPQEIEQEIEDRGRVAAEVVAAFHAAQ